MKKRIYAQPVLEIMVIEPETVICISGEDQEHEVIIDPGTSVGKPGRASGYRTTWKAPSSGEE